MVYYERHDAHECEAPVYRVDSNRWNGYYKRFSKKKPSSGLCAVFSVVERWNPDTVGLIGFDWVLDGQSGHGFENHDVKAEKRCLLSLVNVVDLRNDQALCRI